MAPDQETARLARCCCLPCMHLQVLLNCSASKAMQLELTIRSPLVLVSAAATSQIRAVRGEPGATRQRHERLSFAARCSSASGADMSRLQHELLELQEKLKELQQKLAARDGALKSLQTAHSESLDRLANNQVLPLMRAGRMHQPLRQGNDVVSCMQRRQKKQVPRSHLPI